MKRCDAYFNFKDKNIVYWILPNWFSSNFEEDRPFKKWSIILK